MGFILKGKAPVVILALIHLSLFLPPVQDSFHVVVQYLGQEVLNRQIQGSDVRIMYLPSSVTAPTPSVLKDRFPRIPLPEPPSTLPASQELQALFTLLPFMEKGVVLTSTAKGVYGKRFCQGRVFWTGAHTTTLGLHKMERNTNPVLLFNKDAFTQREFKNIPLFSFQTVNCVISSQCILINIIFFALESELEHFRSNGGEPPQCGFTLCFGEELSTTEDLSRKLIIVQVNVRTASHFGGD